MRKGAQRGHIVTEETRRKIKEALKGRELSEKHKRKISKTLEGHIATEETKKKIRENHKGMLGKFHSEEIKLKMRKAHEGYIVTEGTKRKIREALKGENSHLWKGGISFEPYGIEFDKKLKGKIKERDNNTCQLCKTAKGLAIHHIDYNKKNNKSDNLITLCQSCNSKVNFTRGFWTGYFVAVQQRMK